MFFLMQPSQRFVPQMSISGNPVTIAYLPIWDSPFLKPIFPLDAVSQNDHLSGLLHTLITSFGVFLLLQHLWSKERFLLSSKH